ncbi:hypothetical protein Tco_0768784 [Tanacetum coccineum]
MVDTDCDSQNVSNGSNATQLAILQNTLSAFTLNDSEDAWVWTVDSPSFTVKSDRCQIDRGFLPDDGPGIRWNNLLPKKINIFIWRTLRDRLPSRWNLSRKGIEPPQFGFVFLNAVDLHFPLSEFEIWSIHFGLMSSYCRIQKKAFRVLCGVVLWQFTLFDGIPLDVIRNPISWNNWIQNPLVVFSL